MKDALGHGSDGRGTPAKPIPNSPYHLKSDAELRYIVKDASEAERASRGMTSYNPDSSQRSDTSGKYADQVNDAASVLGYRDRGGLSMHPGDVVSREAVSASDKSAKVPTHDSMGSLSPGGRQGYSRDAVNSAIASSNRSGRRIGGNEARMIHALLKGR
jgi:hypothetical protein